MLHPVLEDVHIDGHYNSLGPGTQCFCLTDGYNMMHGTTRFFHHSRRVPVSLDGLDTNCLNKVFATLHSFISNFS